MFTVQTADGWIMARFETQEEAMNFLVENQPRARFIGHD